MCVVYEFTLQLRRNTTYCFCRAMPCCTSMASPSCGVCPSVCLSVCPTVRHVRVFRLNERINISSKCFHHPVVLPNVRPMAILRRGPPNVSVKCRWGRQESRFSTNLWLHRVLRTLRPPSTHSCAGPWQVMVTLAGKRRRLLLTERKNCL